jgi:hypothetical protein
VVRSRGNGHPLAGLIDQVRDPEVEHLGAETSKAVGLEPDVVGLEVAVDDPVLVRLLHRGADLVEDLHHAGQGQALLLAEHLTQAAPVEVFHDQIGHLVITQPSESEVGDVDDVGMSQPAGRACLAPEALHEVAVPHELRSDQLQSDLASGPDMGGQIHRTHATAPEEALEAVFVGKGRAQAIQRAGCPRRIGLIQGHHPDRMPLGVGLLHGQLGVVCGSLLSGGSDRDRTCTGGYPTARGIFPGAGFMPSDFALGFGHQIAKSLYSGLTASSGGFSMPAATVALVPCSTRMKAPVSRLVP